MFYEEFLDLSRSLEEHHSIFYKFWKLGNPEWTKRVPTAAVAFDKIGDCVQFMLNKDFWEQRTFQQKKFIIAHECMHVIFYHGVRSTLIARDEKDIANRAMDIVVNHTLVDSFGFDRELIDPNNEYVWLDNTFPGQNVPGGKSFEYYFDLLRKKKKDNPDDKNKPEKGNPGDGQGELVDSHDFLDSFNDKAFEDMLGKELNKFDVPAALEDMVQREISDIQNEIKQAGLTPGKSFVLAKSKKVIKQKWETVIKHWAQKFSFQKEEEQWLRKSRRMYGMDTAGMFVPSEQEVEEEEKSRICVWFFQDTSGSCQHLANRFFNAAESLDPKRFDVKMFCFDTKVYETTLQSKKLYGFGGTSFTCIDNYIKSEVAKGKKYPRAVFVITDGYGDNVKPEMPDRWNWFLSENYRSCIPKECKIYDLKDFE